MDVAEDGWIYCHDPKCGQLVGLEGYRDSLKMGIEVNGERLPYVKIEYRHNNREDCRGNINLESEPAECETHAWVVVEPGMVSS